MTARPPLPASPVGVSAAGNRTALLVLALLATVLATNVLSAYLRHREAGLGCTPWPDCYGIVDAAASTAVPVTQPVAAALNPDLVIKQAHRVVAGALVVLVLLVLNLCRNATFLSAFERMLPYALAGITLLLAVVGPASYLKTHPAIATANLLGGLLMLAMTWRLLLALRPRAPVATSPATRSLATVALAMLALQAALGAWTSANFAGAACAGVSSCQGPAGGAPGLEAFWYLRELATDASGRIVTDANTWLIHVAHRAGALVAACTALALAVVLLCNRTLTTPALVLSALVLAQVLLGLAGVTTRLPLLIVLAHNLGSALLVLVVVWIRYEVRAR